MNNTNELFKYAGFSEIPEGLRKTHCPSEEIVCEWCKKIDFMAAITYYGLDKNTQFMTLFNQYNIVFLNDKKLQMAAYLLNLFLFNPDTYNWVSDLSRSAIDMFPAIILLSGSRQHILNMQKRNFDSKQIECHKHRVFEACTIGIEVYKINGIGNIQMIWGTLFINAHIIEIGRLQYEIKKYDYKIQDFEPKNIFCIGIHIPRGEKLNDLAVEQSLKKASRVISKYFPEASKSPLYFIDSWLLSKGLEEFLSPDNNICRFRNRFQILYYLNCSSLPKFLFNDTSLKHNINEYPEDTSLRLGVKQALLTGQTFFDGVGVLKSENH